MKPRDRYGFASYSLYEIQLQMTSVSAMLLTASARRGIQAAGMTQVEALDVVRRLRAADIYKTMPCHANPDVWQDVYHARWQGRMLYVKFQRVGKYFVISFKDL